MHMILFIKIYQAYSLCVWKSKSLDRFAFSTIVSFSVFLAFAILEPKLVLFLKASLDCCIVLSCSCLSTLHVCTDVFFE
jgi:hypothetical protein